MRHKIPIVLLSLWLLAIMQVRAQEEYVSPPSVLLAQVPFSLLTGGVIIVNARLEGHPDTLNFILDTGSSGISLDSTRVLQLKLVTKASNIRIRGIAGIRNVRFVHDQKMHFPGLSVDSLNFHINDYSFLSQVYGLRIDGIIGFSLFSRYIIKLNYDSLKIDIQSKGTLKYPRGGYLIKPFISTLPVHQARIKDHTTSSPLFLHDIGAGVCLMLSQDFVTDSSFIKKHRKIWPKEGRGIGGRVGMQITLSSELKIGPYRFRNVPTTIFDDVYNVTSYPYLAGLIGNDILRRFNVIYNYPKKEIHLLPNSSFRDPFDYAYSGTELLLIDNLIYIGHVAKDSPAELAGLLENDLVIGIDKLVNNNFQQYKKELQKPNSKAKLIIKRGDQVLEILLKIKSIK